VEADKSEAETLKIGGTPTFVFGRIASDGRLRATDVIAGAKPLESFRTILNRLLASRLG
jgi:predicted DsbA family dithiol-disulfide isomerase